MALTDKAQMRLESLKIAATLIAGVPLLQDKIRQQATGGGKTAEQATMARLDEIATLVTAQIGH